MELSEEGFDFSFEGDLSARTQMVSPRHISIVQKPRAAPAAAVEPLSSGCKILLIEDEALIAMQLKLDLEEYGHVVIGPIPQLSEALRVAAEFDFDIALIDINLGADNSAPVAEILDRRHIPFAFTTGYNDLIFMPPLLRDYPHLTKPYNPADVKDLVAELQRQALERAALSHDDANQVA